MHAYLAEFIGTAILILLGNGVVANVVLKDTKGHGGGWIVIAMGWGMAVFVAVLCTAEYSGAHINPAVTFALALAGAFDWALVPGYVLAQVAGGFVGGALVYLFYFNHYAVSDDPAGKLATFSTAPNIRKNTPINFICEVIGTFVLVFAVMSRVGVTFIIEGATQAQGTVGLGQYDALPVGLIVLAIGLSLGGTTGYAINPARDLGPRLAHALLPIPGKSGSDFAYGWVPILGPLLGGAMAAAANMLIA